jgi:hypothetical protein
MPQQPPLHAHTIGSLHTTAPAWDMNLQIMYFFAPPSFELYADLVASYQVVK